MDESEQARRQLDQCNIISVFIFLLFNKGYESKAGNGLSSIEMAWKVWSLWQLRKASYTVLYGQAAIH